MVKFKWMPKFDTSVNLPGIKPSKTVCAILVEAIMRNNSVKLFWFEPVVQDEMSLKDISYLELW